MRNAGNAGARDRLFSRSLATLIEGLLSAGLHCKLWHPAMSKTDKIPDPKELYLRGRSTGAGRTEETQGSEQTMP